jgi:hypothetical protein
MAGAKRMVGKKGSGATEWRALLQVVPVTGGRVMSVFKECG